MEIRRARGIFHPFLPPVPTPSSLHNCSIQSAAPRLKQELDIVETQLAVLLAGGAFASIDARPPDLRAAVVAVAASYPKLSTLEATQGKI